jgi:hypothetical protein
MRNRKGKMACHQKGKRRIDFQSPDFTLATLIPRLATPGAWNLEFGTFTSRNSLSHNLSRARSRPIAEGTHASRPVQFLHSAFFLPPSANPCQPLRGVDTQPNVQRIHK